MNQLGWTRCSQHGGMGLDRFGKMLYRSPKGFETCRRILALLLRALLRCE